MKVIFTPEAFNQTYGGVSRVFAELSSSLNSSGHNAQVVAGLHLNDYLKGRPNILGIRVPNAGKVRSIVNTALCRAVIALSREAIVHQTYYSRHNYPRNHPLVLTVFDMTHEVYSDLFQSFPDQIKQSRNKRICCERADHICAISEHTKRDLVKILGVRSEKISVTYLGNPLAQVIPDSEVSLEGFRYILYVGGRAWYKNFPRLLEAYSDSDYLRRNFRLVCFGGGPFSSSELQLLANLGLTENIVYRTGGDRTLATYYRHAVAHVCTSLYEGFGLTLLEAMGFECPVVSSNRASLPEVGGDAALYFDPENVSQIKAVLEETLSDESTLQRARQHGLEREKLFGWDICAAQTLKAYERVSVC